MLSISSKMQLLKENRLVKNVLLLKITFTLTGIISYLFLPLSLLEYFGIGSSETITFIRSLGLAYIGLLFVYSTGYFQITKKNIYPINVILFGIFMNGGAFILIIINIFTDWLKYSQFNVTIINSVMMFLFFFIALMFIISLTKNYRKYKNDIIWNILWKK